jgi:tetratricopeptide (TPR) repeat protein
MTIIANNYNDLMESKKAEEKQLGFILFKQDRENLYKALHRVLDKEGDFYPLYIVFAQFYHQHPLYNEAIEFMEGVVKKLALFSKKEQNFLARYAVVVGNLGNNYQKIKNFPKARKNYKKGLKLLQKAGNQQETSVAYHQLGRVAQEERDWKEAKRYYLEALKIKQEFNDRYSQASTFHHLGWMSQEERDWKEAKRNYLEALKIDQEFNDRYSQASTFHQLGRVAKEEKDYAASLEYYALALEIFHKYNDEYNLGITIKNLSRLMAMEEWDAAEAIEQLEKDEETKKALRAILEKVKKKE